ncbi:hypothetical protein OSTOST_02043 [Ostertagia ostertagi]
MRSKRASHVIVKRGATDESAITLRMKRGRDLLEGTLWLRNVNDKHPFLCSRIPKPTDEEIDPKKNESLNAFHEVEFPSTTTEEPEETTTESVNKVSQVIVTVKGSEHTTTDDGIRWDFMTPFPERLTRRTEDVGQSGTTEKQEPEGTEGSRIQESTPGQVPEEAVTFPRETTRDGIPAGKKTEGPGGVFELSTRLMKRMTSYDQPPYP